MKKATVSNNERYMLKGSLKKNGFDWWRVVTSAVSHTTGEECIFFIEFYVVNPALSPQDCVLGFKNRFARTESDLHSALAGTEAAHKIEAETYVLPSFAMVKAGIYGEDGKQINAYYPTGSIETDKQSTVIKLSSANKEPCALTTDSCYGSVSVNATDLESQPELLSQSGSMSWNLHYTKQFSFSPNYKSKTFHWSSYGARTTFEGHIVFDGEEFDVIPEKSYGYIDKNWGKEFPSPFFHLNSSSFTSIINGKTLKSSTFVAQGVFNKRLSVLTSIEGLNIEFNASKRKKYFLNYDCSEMPVEDDVPPKLHWSISVNNKRYVVDIDVFCHTTSMFLRDYELPFGNRKVMRILGGGTGEGELRIYKQIHKNLELIEHVRMANVICEYGNIELPTM